MSPVAFLAEHGQELLLGSTLILGAGCLWLLASKAPVHRRRTGVLAIQATLCWLGLALVPLPRLGQVTEPRAASLEGGAGPPPGEGPAFLPEESDLRRPSQLSRPHPEAREMMPGPDLPGQHALPASPVQVEDLAAWLPALYLIGVALCAAWSLIGAILLRRILGTAQALPPSCRGVLRELSRSKREQAIRVRMTKRRLRPFSCGVLRPTVILPAALCAPSRADQLRQVLLHELAHVRAGDGWTQLLLAFARPFLWVHPLYWWLEGRIRLASELLADDWAASQGDRQSYARQLIGLAEQDALRQAWPAAAAGMFRSRSEFYRRMEMLLDRRTMLSRSCSLKRHGANLAGAALLVALATSLWGARSAGAQDLTAEPSRQKRNPLEQPPERPVPVEAVEEAVEEAEIVEPWEPLPPGQLQDTLRELRKLEDRLAQVQRENQELRARIASLSRTSEDLARRSFRTARPEHSHYVRVRAEAGDTLRSLVERHCGSSRYLSLARELNKGLDPTRLVPGQTILLPQVSRRGPSGTTLSGPLLETTEAGRASVRPEAPSGFAGSAVQPNRRYILDLITRAIDLEGELEQHVLARKKRLSDRSLVSEEELLEAEIGYRTRTRKLELLRNLMEVELEALKGELRLLTKERRTRGRGGWRRKAAETAILRVESQIKILRSAMTRSGASSPRRRASK